MNVYKHESHEKYTEKEPNIFVRDLFLGRDWNEFIIDEQLVIKGDTAYICCY